MVASNAYQSPPASPAVLRLILPLPPVINSYWRSVTIKGAARVLLSAEARRYHKAVARELEGMDEIDYPVLLGVTVYIGRRGTDVDAHIKATLDTLEKAGLLGDDNLVCGFTRWLRRYDNANPRIELDITRATDPALIDAISPSRLKTANLHSALPRKSAQLPLSGPTSMNRPGFAGGSNP